MNKPTGRPSTYNESKKQIALYVTPTAIASLNRLAAQLKISRSELIEQIARDEELLTQLALRIN